MKPTCHSGAVLPPPPPPPSGTSARRPRPGRSAPWTLFRFRACSAEYLTQKKRVRGGGKEPFYPSAAFSWYRNQSIKIKKSFKFPRIPLTANNFLRTFFPGTILPGTFFHGDFVSRGPFFLGPFYRWPFFRGSFVQGFFSRGQFFRGFFFRVPKSRVSEIFYEILMSWEHINENFMNEVLQISFIEFNEQSKIWIEKRS